jgi:hypothetical protein
MNAYFIAKFTGTVLFDACLGPLFTLSLAFTSFTLLEFIATQASQVLPFDFIEFVVQFTVIIIKFKVNIDITDSLLKSMAQFTLFTELLFGLNHFFYPG